MPLSEFYRMAKSKLESAQQRTTPFSTDLSFVPDNELVELVWENGQIMMQGQSSRSRSSPISNKFPSHVARLRDKDVGNTTTTSKIGKLGTVESVLNDIPLSVPSEEMGLSEDDDMVPWLNYPIDNPLHQDYCSELLPELSGVTVSEPSIQNTLQSIDKRSSFHQTIRDSHDGPVHNGAARSEQGGPTKVSSSSRTDQIYHWSSEQGQPFVPSRGTLFSDSISGNTSSSHHAVCGDSAQDQDIAGGIPSTKMQKEDSGLPSRNSTVLNFSHFSRPAAIVRANLQNISSLAISGSSDFEKMGDKSKKPVVNGSNPVETTFAGPSRGSQEEMDFHSQADMVSSSKVDSKSLMTKPQEESYFAERSDAVCGGDVSRSEQSPDQIIRCHTSKGGPDSERTVEPIVASSSACSGYSAERASNDLTNNLKRKCRDTDESECRSEDVEEESVGVKKPGPARGGSSSKRSRAAEVHNLSERRRRDRINEKMRALQELIPNCNKVDKASMLDEAIEYLKTLQLQVQIMSMGTGLYMPPMMLPTGMQHIHAAHMPHFSTMGVGMGYGMSFLDMNGGAHGCPMISMPPIQGAHFPSPSITGPLNFPRMPGPNLQVFGHPSQGYHMSVPRAPLVPLSEGLPMNSAMGLSASRTGFQVEVPSSVSTSRDLMQYNNSQAIHNTDTGCSMNKSSQVKGSNDGLDLLVPKNDKVTEAEADADLIVNPTKTNVIEPSKTAGCE